MEADAPWHHPMCSGADITEWARDKHWVAYNEVVSPELHDAVRAQDEAFLAGNEVFDHAKERLVECPWQAEQSGDRGEFQPEPAARRSPSPERSAPVAAASSSAEGAATWQASWA